MGLIGAIPSRKCSILRHLQNEEITHSVMLPEALEHFVLLKTQTWPICFEDSSSRVGLTKNRYKTSFFSFSYLRNFFYQEHKFIYSIFCKNSAIMPYHIFYKVSDGEKTIHCIKITIYFTIFFPFLPNLTIFYICKERALMVRYTADAANLGKYYKYSKKRRKALFKLHSTHFTSIK